MQITKEWLEARMDNLRQQETMAKAQLSAVNGAIQECMRMQDMLSAPEPESTHEEDPLK